MLLIKPTDIYEVAQDIITFADREDISDNDKKVIITMVKDFYADRNEYTVDQWLTQFSQRILDRKFPPTSIE